MAHRQGGSGGNMARPSFTPSFPNQGDASIGARAPQLGHHHPSADALVPLPPAVAPQAYFQPNNYAHGWFQAHLPPPPPPQQQQQQAHSAPRYAPLQPHVEPPPPPPPPQQDARILQRRRMAPMAAPNVVINSAAPVDGYGVGATSWARRPMLPPSAGSGWPAGSWAPPPVQVQQQPGGGGGQTSWVWAPPAQQRRPEMPPAAASPAASGGSAHQAPPPRVVPASRKTFEEFLLEAGVLDQWALDKIFLDDLAHEMLRDDDDGQAERDDGRLVSLGDVLLSLGVGVGAGSSSSGPSTSTRQVRVPAQQEALAAAAAAGDQAAADEARGWRSRRMAKRKEAAARHAAPRGS